MQKRNIPKKSKISKCQIKIIFVLDRPSIDVLRQFLELDGAEISLLRIH